MSARRAPSRARVRLSPNPTRRAVPDDPTADDPTADALATGGFRAWHAALVPLTDTEWAAVDARLRPAHLRAGEAFVREGETRRRVGYVCRGVLRHAALRGGAEHVVGFVFEDDVAGDFGSFFDGTPATNAVVAIEATDLLVLSHDDWLAAGRVVPALLGIQTAVASRLFEGARARAVEMQQFTAEARYRRLLARSPHVLQRVPLYMVASYLGVTPEALSRIRRRLA